MRRVPLQHIYDARKIIGYVFIVFSAIFVFYITINYCFSTKEWLLGGSDGTFSYLLNGLNVATLHSVGHTDHPGTILQILCGVLLRIFYFFAPDSNSNSIVMSVLTQPEWYLKKIFTSIFVLQAVILAAVASRVWLSFNNVGLLIVILASPFASPLLIITQSAQIWPEILLPSLFLLLALVTLKRWREYTMDVPIPSRVLALITGALTGVALFTKIIYFPVFLVSFFFWNDKKSRCHYIIGVACVMLICIPFIWGLLGRTISWFIALALHAEHYGSGSATIVDPAYFYANIIEIISSNIPTVILFAITICGLLIFRKERHKLGWKIPALFTFAAFILIIIVAKHYQSRYLLPIISTCYFVPLICSAQFKNVVLSTIVVCIICCFLSSYTLYNSAVNKVRGNYFSGKYSNYDDNIFQGKNIVESYNTFTISYGLSLGSDFSKNRHGELLRTIYPNRFNYNIWNKQFYHFGNSVSFEEIASGGPVIIRGTLLKGDYCKNLIFGKELASFPEGDVLYELLGEKK
jgi:hypothetical protein